MNGERSFLSAQRTEPQLRYVYAIYVRLYFNRAGIRPDYANCIFAKQITGSVISYSHYTRFYALIGRVCSPAITWRFSSSIRNIDELQKDSQPQRTGIEGSNGHAPHPPPKWREVSRQSRETAKGTKGPHSHVIHSATQSEDVVVAGSGG